MFTEDNPVTGWKEAEGVRKEEGRERLAASGRMAANSDSCSTLVISNVLYTPFLITVNGALSGELLHVTATKGAGNWQGRRGRLQVLV